MKRSRVVLFLTPSVLAMIVLAASCSDGTEKKSQKAGTGRYYQPKDGGDGSTSTSSSTSLEGGIPDAPEMMIPRELKSAGQALQVLITAHDLEIKEAEFGKDNGKTPVMQAYLNDLVQDVKAARARVKGLAKKKKVTPTRSNMTDRMRFESQASLTHLKNIFQNMFFDTYLTRRIDTSNNLIRLIDNELAPLLSEDEDYKEELATTVAELEKRIARAEEVKSGLADGPTSSQGMFEEIEGPVGPIMDTEDEPEEEEPPAPPAPTGDGGS